MIEYDFIDSICKYLPEIFCIDKKTIIAYKLLKIELINYKTKW